MNIIKKIIGLSTIFFGISVLLGDVGVWINQVSYGQAVLGIFTACWLLFIGGFLSLKILEWAFDF